MKRRDFLKRLAVLPAAPLALAGLIKAKEPQRLNAQGTEADFVIHQGKHKVAIIEDHTEQQKLFKQVLLFLA